MMRPRTDFYTLCPQCETRVSLTLASKLQSSRAGCSCACSNCKHEWIAIHEWIYRDQISPVTSAASNIPTMPPQTVLHNPMTSSSVPKPHIPMGSPIPAPLGAVASSSVPQPHAWNWERQQSSRNTQYATQFTPETGYSGQQYQ